MKPGIVVLCGLLLAELAWSANGNQPAPDPMIAVVNIAQVFERYQMTRDLEARFDALRNNIADEAKNRRKAMDNQLAALEAFDPASRDYTQRRDELRRSGVEYKVWLEVEELRLKEEHKAWLRLIYEDARRTAAQIAQSREIDLVLTYSELSEDAPDSVALRQEILLKKVLYFSQRTDLTGEVLRLVNESYEQKGGASSLRTVPAGPS